jgi:drug/metabolite transporter (DMT)-like permease
MQLIGKMITARRHANEGTDWDRLGIAASSLCVVHCLLLPLLPAALSVMGLSLFTHESFHAVLFLLIAPLAAFALWRGHRHHGRHGVVVLGACGVACVCAGAHVHHAGELVEMGLSVSGSLALVGSHVWNRRLIVAKPAGCCSGH